MRSTLIPTLAAVVLLAVGNTGSEAQARAARDRREDVRDRSEDGGRR